MAVKAGRLPISNPPQRHLPADEREKREEQTAKELEFLRGSKRAMLTGERRGRAENGKYAEREPLLDRSEGKQDGYTECSAKGR